MADFLLELRSEEIPARMQAKARDDFARLFAAELDRAGLKASELVTYATPRRLALIARDLPLETAAVFEETKGPRTSAPAQALEGFLRKTGLAKDRLEDRDGIWFAVVNKPGRKTAEVLAEAIPAIVRAFPWPKAMRWGAASASTESLRWVRPLQGIIALLGEEVVPFEIAGVASGASTLGHRFHHPGAITIGSAADYVEKLCACHVIVDSDERARVIREGAAKLAAEAGLDLIEDEGLVAENAGLTEWPAPLLGRFDEAFLAVPPEVIQLTARVNQKYFVCRGSDGTLANAFICTANIAATDGGAKIVEGNRKVLAARLADAKFFCETDLKTRLEDQLPKLEKIVFHEKLGTVADKVERVAKLARWLVEEGIIPLPAREGLGVGADAEGGGSGAGSERDPAGRAPTPAPSLAGRGEERAELARLAERAARLAKADLVTGMVGEFPELQGMMGGYYAAAQGEPQAVAEAIRDHYKPVGQGDDVPTAPVTMAVSLADKLDSLVGFYANRMKPTGSRDPFGLRRAVIGLSSQIERSGIRLHLASAITKSLNLYHAQWLEQFAAMQPYFDGEALRLSYLETNPRNSDTFFFGPLVLVLDVKDPLFSTYEPQASRVLRSGLEVEEELLDFFADRLKVQQREAGVRHDLIDAVFALGGEDDLVRLLDRVHALQAFVGTEDGANLLAGYKRAANILKKEGFEAPLPGREGLGVGADAEGGGSDARGERDPAGRAPTPDPSLAGRGQALPYTPEPAEAALIAALDNAAPAAAEAVAREDFEDAMAALASLRAPIDAFFEHVTVNDANQDKRAARLALLARIRDAVHGVADFSKIEG